LLFLLILLTAACFILIIKGADIFLDSAIYIAKKTGMSQVLIGATIVSVGTTLPEITVSTIAAIQGDFSLSVSNAVGSIFCNTAFILGVAFICVSTVLNRKAFLGKIIFLIVTVTLILIFSLLGYFNIYEALVLLALFAVYIVYNIYQAKRPQTDLIAENDGKPLKARKTSLVILMFVLGALCIGAGAYFLIDAITKIAVDYLGVSTGILGVTVVALGTSLPELFTAITAVRKKSVQISMGNIIGANMINGTFILGICGAIGRRFEINTHDTLYVATNGNISSAVLCSVLGFAVILIAFVPILFKGKTFKWQGYLLTGAYFSYILYLILAIA